MEVVTAQEGTLMKKTLAIFLSACLAVIILYCGASYWLGGQAREQHDRLLAQINRSNSLEASTSNYQRGLFSSTAVTGFTLTRPKNAGTVRFNIISTVYHGPFVFLRNQHLKGNFRPVLAVIQTKFAPTGDSADALKKVLETVPELGASEVLTVLFINGDGESYFDVPSFQKSFPDDAGGPFDVQWSGFSARSNFNVQLSEVRGSWNSSYLQITGHDQSAVRVKDFQGNFNSRPGIKDINIGSANLSIGSIWVGEKEKSPLTLSSLGIKAESGVSGETICCALHLSFDKLDAQGMAIGPFAMEFEARKLDPEVLSRVRKLAGDFQTKAASSDGIVDAEREMKKMGETILLDLLAKSPEFEMKELRLSTDKGNLSGKAKLSFGGPAQNILLLLASIDASAECSVSEPLGYFVAENLLANSGQAPGSLKTSAESIVKGLVSAKYINSEGGSLKSSAAYKRGALTINGRKLDLSNLKHIGQ
jgi:uncharacterized protein YdgA (DUF945 family)